MKGRLRNYFSGLDNLLLINGTCYPCIRTITGRQTERTYDIARSHLGFFYTGNMPLESVMVHRIVFSENYEAELTLKDKSKTEDTDWYHVRVVQSNGSLVWSSPIWVNKNEK